MAMALRFVPFDSFRVDKMRGLEPAMLSSELDTDPEDDDGVLLKDQSRGLTWLMKRPAGRAVLI